MTTEHIRTDLPTRGYEGFEGVVAERFSESTPWRPPVSRARRGAPNVVVILVDDLGFADTSPFGSEIATPHIEALAQRGYRMANFHAAPLCAPSRAALLTGINSHRAGVGMVSGDPGFPGYRTQLHAQAPTLAETYRANGYATFMVGKWHLTRDDNMHDGADKSSWPLQRGFDRYFGGLDGFTTLFHPHRLVRDNSSVPQEHLDDDAYLTDTLTDEAIDMISELRQSGERKPFFLYFAHHAVHGPIQAKDADLAAQRGRYDEGWDAIRAARFERQRALGLWDDDVELPASSLGGDARPWDSYDPEQREVFARLMEVYAASVTSVDDSVGRLVALLEEFGELENTVIVFLSDNGATSEGGEQGTRSYFSQFAQGVPLPEDWVTDVPRPLDLLGTAQTHVHYPQGWAHASNTPFRGFKSGVREGGVHVPMIFSWPGGVPRDTAENGIRHDYAHIVDLAPTLLDLTQARRPKERQGLPALDVDGVSFAGTLTGRSADEATRERRQHSESGGNRLYVSGRYKALSPFRRGPDGGQSPWELYDTEADPTELHDLSTAEPERVDEMAEAFRRAAWWNTVFPLDDTGRMMAGRPDTVLDFEQPITLRPSSRVMERARSSRLIRLRSVTIDAEAVVDASSEGVIVSHGDQGGGYILWLEDGRLHFTYNAYGDVHRIDAPLVARGGTRAIRLDFAAGEGIVWDIELAVDGAPLARLDGMPMLIGMAPFTGISVGIDYGGPVDEDLRQRRGHFPLAHGLHAVRYNPGQKAPYNREIVQQIDVIVAGQED